MSGYLTTTRQANDANKANKDAALAVNADNKKQE